MLPTNEAEFTSDQNWRVIFAVPILFAVVQIALYLLVCPYEPLNFSIAKGNEAEAIGLMRKIYTVRQEAGKSSDDDVYLQFFEF